MRGSYLDPGKLFTGRSVLMHMSHGAHGIAVYVAHAVRKLELSIRLPRATEFGLQTGCDPFATWASCKGDERHAALACGNRLGCMAHQGEVRCAPDVGRVGMPHAQVKVFDHGRGPHAGRIAGTEIPVNVFTRQTGVRQRTNRHFRMQFGQRFVWRVSRRVLIGTDDVRLTVDAHGRSPTGFASDPGSRSALAWPRITTLSPTWAVSSNRVSSPSHSMTVDTVSTV